MWQKSQWPSDYLDEATLAAPRRIQNLHDGKASRRENELIPAQIESYFRRVRLLWRL